MAIVRRGITGEREDPEKTNVTDPAVGVVLPGEYSSLEHKAKDCPYKYTFKPEGSNLKGLPDFYRVKQVNRNADDPSSENVVLNGKKFYLETKTKIGNYFQLISILIDTGCKYNLLSRTAYYNLGQKRHNLSQVMINENLFSASGDPLYPVDR